MKKLNVEANKAFYHGFILTEQELRRFNDLIQDQLKKESEGEIKNSFSVTFESGVVAETIDIEEIFSLENSGSAKIIDLKISSEITDSRKLVIEFTNANSSNVSTEISIRYNISGLTRDWVFVTSSLIEERIKKIRRWNINYNFKKTNYKLLMMLSMPFSLIIALMFELINGDYERQIAIEEIRNEYESGKLTEPIEAFLKINEIGQSLDSATALIYAFLTTGGLFIILLLVHWYLYALYPVYNFCWGDYLATFKKRESLRKTIDTVVIIGLIISVIGGIIANQIGK
ncbi:hypothetical protein SAMN05192553_102696 [Cyclobacterium xiamenense]|uniref:Uncharacterized protein n=1 Tax=Cyclobacterium xiamenense TaxID=1297121 RepID=A0A1H6WH12_9BACT|nr:hypothetical protein [Cyclobacterium xiamenense]SEJ16183.1 hypothetical protein SAMN05192553_102696 [Cyclobacterium xiamenense]